MVLGILHRKHGFEFAAKGAIRSQEVYRNRLAVETKNMVDSVPGFRLWLLCFERAEEGTTRGTEDHLGNTVLETWSRGFVKIRQNGR